MKVYEIDNKTVEGEVAEFTVRYATVDPRDIKGRLIRNPGYGGPGVGIHGWCSATALSACRKPSFRAELADSIKREGLRNPVVLYSTPEGLYLSFGGSRASAALDVGLEAIPAIINDYTGDYDDCESVDEENWTDFFTDVPQWHEFGETGFDYHYSLERNRRDTYDEAGFNWIGDEFWKIAHEFSWVDK